MQGEMARRSARALEAAREVRSRFRVALVIVEVESGEVQVWAGTRLLLEGMGCVALVANVELSGRTATRYCQLKFVADFG